MRTIRIVQTGIRDQEVVENLAANQRLRDDPRNVIDRDMTVPDPLGIDHDCGSMLALFQATRLIGSCQGAEAPFLELFFEGVAEGLRPLGIAAPAFVSGRADVAANENVVSERGHIRSRLPIECFSPAPRPDPLLSVSWSGA